MLEEIPGNFLVEKLRTILLIKEDYNTLLNINFNGKLMPYLEAFYAAPQEAPIFR